MLATSEIRKLASEISGLNVLVIGDVMIDSYIWGSVDRLSPEAPVPVVSVSKRENRLGGAANVALNVQSLGATPYLCSVCGKDEKFTVFNTLMKQNGLPTKGIICSEHRITTTKFRVIGNNYQMLRVDEENDSPLDATDTLAFISSIKAMLRNVKPDVVIFEDYDKGVITAEVIKAVIEETRRRGIPVCVDPKKRNFHYYNGATLFKPNLKEFREGLGISGRQQELIRAAKDFIREKNIGHMLLTMSEAGVCVVSNDKGRPVRIPAEVRNVADVSGAGDTVIAVASLCLATGMEAGSAAWVANVAGGLVCEEVGVVPVSKTKLFNELAGLAARNKRRARL